MLGTPQKTFRNRILLAVPLLGLGVSLLGACEKSQEEILAELSEKIRAGQTQEAASEIQALLADTNNSLSELFESRPKKGSLAVSLGGEVAAWLDGESIYYHTSDGVHSHEGEGVPVAFRLSSGGRFMSATFRDSDGCHLQLIDTQEQDAEDHPFRGSCDEPPVVSEDGSTLFAVEKSKIRAIPLHNTKPESGLKMESATLRPSLPEDIPLSVFQIKLKKFQPKLRLLQIGQRGWSAWYGRAGLYRLYFYPGSGSKVLTNKTVLSRPFFYTSYDGDTLPLLDTKQEAPKPQDSKASAKYEFEKAQAFVYSGGAGKRKLRALYFGEDLKMGAPFPSPIWDDLQFIRDREEFMALKKRHLYYWNPISRKKQLLPLLAREFLLFDGGLLYVDLMGRLYLRKAPFSDFELKLVELRKQARSH